MLLACESARPIPYRALTQGGPPALPGDACVSGLLESNRAGIDSLDRLLQEALQKQQSAHQECDRLATRCDDLLVPMKPLATRLQIAAKAENIGRYTGLVSGMNLFAGRLLTVLAPNLAVPFMIADVAVLAASFAAVHWGRTTWSQGYPQLEKMVDRWNSEKTRLDRARSLDQQQNREVTRLDALLKDARGQHQVLEVAAAVTGPPPADISAGISQDDDAIVIGQIRIPRRIGTPGESSRSR